MNEYREYTNEESYEFNCELQLQGSQGHNKWILHLSGWGSDEQFIDAGNKILKPFQIGKAAGPSGLQVQHLLDVASVPLPTTICSLLR